MPRHLLGVVRRQWFLVCVTFGLVLSLLWPEMVRPTVAWLPTRAVVAGALFLTAWGLESRRLLRALTRPVPVLWALFVGYGFLPALAWLSGALLPSLDLRIGLLVMAAVPCTLASAVLWTRLAGGNEATALLIVLVMTLVGPVVTPAWLALLVGTASLPSTWQMMRDLAVVLVLPVGLAQCSRAFPFFAQTALNHKTTIGVVARLLVLVVMLKAAVDLAHFLSRLTAGSVLLAAVVCHAVHLAALALGYCNGEPEHWAAYREASTACYRLRFRIVRRPCRWRSICIRPTMPPTTPWRFCRWLCTTWGSYWLIRSSPTAWPVGSTREERTRLTSVLRSRS